MNDLFITALKLQQLTEQQDALDWEYVYKYLTPLLEAKESGDILSRLKKLRTSLAPAS